MLVKSGENVGKTNESFSTLKSLQPNFREIPEESHPCVFSTILPRRTAVQSPALFVTGNMVTRNLVQP